MTTTIDTPQKLKNAIFGNAGFSIYQSPREIRRNQLKEIISNNPDLNFRELKNDIEETLTGRTRTYRTLKNGQKRCILSYPDVLNYESLKRFFKPVKIA